MARFCTVRSFIPASNSCSTLRDHDDDMHSKKYKSKNENDVSARKHLLINGLGMDALANGWVGSMDMARCRPERQRERANAGDRPYIFPFPLHSEE